MLMTFHEIVESIRELPPELQQEVGIFAHSLVERSRTNGKRIPASAAKPMTLKWRGALSHLREEYTAVELQHEILKWWTDDISG